MLDFVRHFLQTDSNAAAVLALVLTALAVLLLLGWLILALRVRRLGRQVYALTRGVEGQNLEGVLSAHLESVAQTLRRMESLEQAVAILQAQMPSRLCQANLIRYNAFEDVGGEQSFSLALLDAQGDGVVLTSVYSRMDVRVYAKAIRQGQPSHALSQEEERALREAAIR